MHCDSASEGSLAGGVFFSLLGGIGGEGEVRECEEYEVPCSKKSHEMAVLARPQSPAAARHNNLTDAWK